jgi:hypothetical protein
MVRLRANQNKDNCKITDEFSYNQYTHIKAIHKYSLLERP